MSSTIFAGSCLCGSVQYAIEGQSTRFYHCHCSRCRKMSGTGHATNIMVETDSIDWQKGESLLGYYKVPEAKRFFNQFCTQCGSPLPRKVPGMNLVVIPAGSLDSKPDLKPQARIFWDSRTEWSCDAGDLEIFSEYPPA